MDKIMLYSSGNMNATSVSNIFIDSYMPAANGSYVKVYLYLLRCLSGRVEEFSISYLADRLDHTEKDIMRALKYWEKVRLLKLSFDPNGAVTSISLNDPKPAEETPETSDPEAIRPEAARQGRREGEEEIAAGESAAAQETAPDVRNGAAYTASDEPLQEVMPEKKEYSLEQIQKLSENEEVKWVMNIIEQYLERPLKPKDIQLILYLYDSVGFSSELIMYLYEYCISKHKKNASYIEAVAIAWAEQGISTVEEAEASNTLYSSSYSAVDKAFGLNRMPGAVEKNYIDKWTGKYKFSIEIITEACNRTILNTQKADFKYADRILENWKSQGVRTMEDIKKQDAVYNRNRGTAAHQAALPNSETQKRQSNNRFNAFPQRKYTREDYENMEKQLLHRQ